MRVWFKGNLDMKKIKLTYRQLCQDNMSMGVVLGWHDDIGPSDSDAMRLYDRDRNLIMREVRGRYKDSGINPDIVIVDGSIERKSALSDRVFRCRTTAYRSLDKALS